MNSFWSFAVLLMPISPSVIFNSISITEQTSSEDIETMFTEGRIRRCKQPVNERSVEPIPYFALKNYRFVHGYVG